MAANECTFVTCPTWKKYIVLSRVIEALRVRDKRVLFNAMRHTRDLDHNTFFPSYGFAAGEFAVWQVLTEQRKTRHVRCHDPPQ
jgi:hypothetical protein